MNFAEISESDDGSEILMMNTYDRLLRLRTVLEHDNFQPKETPDVLESLNALKKDYLALLEEVLMGYEKLQPKKDKADVLFHFVNKFGNDKELQYVKEISALVEQFEKDECIVEMAEELKDKTERMLGMKKVFELCADADILSKYMCFLCLDRTIQTFIDPCGHVICGACAQRNFSTCPFCRGRVLQFRKMFIE
jgi:hypothetical protein